MTDRKKSAKEKQPPETSKQSGSEHDRTVRRGYAAAEDPEAQGDGDPGPDPVSEQSSRQSNDSH